MINLYMFRREISVKNCDYVFGFVIDSQWQLAVCKLIKGPVTYSC